MKSYLCYSPSAPGKPGQLLEVVGDDSVQMYAPPVSYASNDAAPDLAIRHKLWHAKSRGAGSQVIRKLQAEADRVHRDQQQERQQQKVGGDSDAAPPPAASPFSRHVTMNTLREMVASAVAGVTEDPTPKKKKPTKAETKAGWDKHLADLDKWLAKRALAAIYPKPEKGASSPTVAAHARNKVCCEGRYLCHTCKAKAAGA
jgi:hypothetical protein